VGPDCALRLCSRTAEMAVAASFPGNVSGVRHQRDDGGADAAIAASSPLRSGHFKSRMALFFTLASPTGRPFYSNLSETVAH